MSIAAIVIALIVAFLAFKFLTGAIKLIVVIAVILILTGIAWFTGFALSVRAMAAKIVKNSAVIDIITGVIFIALAAFMLWEGVGGLIRAVQ